MILQCLYGVFFIIIATIGYASEPLQKLTEGNQTSSKQEGSDVIQKTGDQDFLQKPIATKLISGRQEIPIGSSLPLKGEISILGGQIFDGISLFFNKLKQDKSLPFMYDLNVLNDEAEIKKVHNNIKTLQHKSPLLLTLQGSDTIASILANKDFENTLKLFPIDSSQLARNAVNRSFIFFRPTHDRELDALVDYSINKLNKKKIAIFYEASEWGEDALKVLKRTLEKYNIPLLAESSYPQHTLNVTKAADDIASKAPNAIVCIAHARPAYNFIRQIINKGLYQTVILGPSTLFSVQNPIKRSRGIDIVTTSVVPDPERSPLKIAQEFRSDMKTYFPNKTLSPLTFESYICASILVECTKLVKFPITAEKILTAIENLKSILFKGLELRFDSQTRTLSHAVWLNTGENKEWELYKPIIQKPGTTS